MNDTKRLSKREQDVADLLLQGKSNKQIATSLGISEHTVEFHLTNIYAKLGVASRAEAILKLGESPVPKIPAEPGISTVDGEGESADNEADIMSRTPTRSGSKVDMKTSWTAASSGAYAIWIWIGILALVSLIGVYSQRGLLEKWADRISMTSLRATHPVPAVDDAQSAALPTLMEQGSPASTRSIAPGTPLPGPRSQHTVTRLQNGEILVVGGYNVADQSTANAALFDPQTGSFQPVASLHTVRHDHTATLLPDGRVLVVGGYTLPQQWLDDAEIYDPAKDTWTVVPPLYSHATAHTATLMKDGRVLVVGGCIGDSVCTEKVEIFDPRTSSWAQAAPLAADRAAHTAQLLQDGRVLVSGGWGAAGMGSDGDALLYDPKTDSWTVTQPMISRRSFAQSVQLRDGRVLVVGGMLPGDGTTQTMTSSTEIYDPDSKTWTAAAETHQPLFGFSLVSLSNGRVLAIGGATAWDRDWNNDSFLGQIEMYNPGSNVWNIVGELPQPVVNLASVLMPGNRVWVTGGRTLDASSADTWMVKITR